MTALVERPLLNRTRLQVMVPGLNPFILGSSWLDGPMLIGGPESTEVWTDYTPEATQIKVRRGGTREGVTIRNGLGTLTVTFKEVPISSENSPFLADMPVRLLSRKATWDEWAPVFTGRIRDVSTQRIPMPEEGGVVTFTTITAVDAIASHDEITRYGAMPPSGYDTFRQRIARVATSAVEPVELPDDDDFLSPFGEILHLGRTLFESSVSNHFTLAASSVGAWWYVDASGITRFAPLRADTSDYIHLPESFYLSEIPDSGTSAQITSLIQRIKGVEPDPDNPGEWLATERDVTPDFSAVGTREAIGNRPAVQEIVASQEYPDFAWTTAAWTAYAFSWATMLAGVRINAQQNDLYGLELGTTVYIPRNITDAGTVQEFYLVIGLHHTITPTRWIIQLDLMGV